MIEKIIYPGVGWWDVTVHLSAEIERKKKGCYQMPRTNKFRVGTRARHVNARRRALPAHAILTRRWRVVRNTRRTRIDWVPETHTTGIQERCGPRACPRSLSEILTRNPPLPRQAGVRSVQTYSAYRGGSSKVDASSFTSDPPNGAVAGGRRTKDIRCRELGKRVTALPLHTTYEIPSRNPCCPGSVRILVRIRARCSGLPLDVRRCRR